MAARPAPAQRAFASRRARPFDVSKRARAAQRANAQPEGESPLAAQSDATAHPGGALREPERAEDESARTNVHRAGLGYPRSITRCVACSVVSCFTTE